MAEFFAGIGLVRAALAPLGAQVVWANDIEDSKFKAYAENAGDAAQTYRVCDIRDVEASDLPPQIDLATSSFPCVDLSLAGNRRGLVGAQSGMFWEFGRIIEEMDARPTAILLENVRGFATSHGGQDLADALALLSKLGYSLDIMAIDAKHFVPQSRPRMFVVGIRQDRLPASAVQGVPPLSEVRPQWVADLHAKHGREVAMHYVELPKLPQGPRDLRGIVEDMRSDDERWWSDTEVAAFVGSLSPVQLTRFLALRDAPTVTHRTAYRRTRHGAAVWELRRDGIAGCLRTTGGGSSRQALVELGGGRAGIRWMTPREYAGLMGAKDFTLLSGTPNQQLFGFGDAVVVDVVRWIGEKYLVPVLRPYLSRRRPEQKRSPYRQLRLPAVPHAASA
jgi:DNA (cytosine-5)-methyltransferase 1